MHTGAAGQQDWRVTQGSQTSVCHCWIVFHQAKAGGSGYVNVDNLSIGADCSERRLVKIVNHEIKFRKRPTSKLPIRRSIVTARWKEGRKQRQDWMTEPTFLGRFGEAGRQQLVAFQAAQVSALADRYRRAPLDTGTCTLP